MADIDIGQITEALNDKTDRDMRNVDTVAKADAVIDYQEPTAENNYTWYRKYKSGWVEQGGIKTIQALVTNLLHCQWKWQIHILIYIFHAKLAQEQA